MRRLATITTQLLATAMLAASPAGAQQPGAAGTPPLYLDTSKPVDARVADLIGRLTLEEKAMLLNHRGSKVERFNIRADQWNQCLNGVKWDRPTTMFPICLAMAATWNTELVQKEIATTISDEARAIYNGWHLDPKAKGEHKGLIYRAPVINIERNPYWGRNHEAWGEDPFLTGRMAVAYVRGLQGDDPRYLKLAATLKHYAVNNVEHGRTSLDAKVSQRMLHEYWLPHFKDAVVEGKACSLMASYNAINGTPNNINHWLLTELLKNEWKHEGFVVSDLGGVRSMVEGHERGKMSFVDAVAQSLMAGCDFSDKEFETYIPEAVRTGKLTEERLNDALRRVLTVRMRLGEFDPFEAVPYSKISPDVIDSPAHRAVALKAAQQSVVLLQNRDNMLPLKQDGLKKVAVLGPLADVVIKHNYSGTVQDAVTVLAGLKAALPGVEITTAPGAQVGRSGRGDEWLPDNTEPPFDVAAEQQRAVELARDADLAILCLGTTTAVEVESRERKKLGLTGTQEQLAQAVLAANPRTVVVLMSAGPLTVTWLKEHAPAMIQAWWPGQQGGNAVADVLFGKVNPAGRLPHTIYASEEQVPPLDEYDVTKGFTYMYLNGAPLYPFGHGLSYTTFSYSNLRLSQPSVAADGQVVVSVDVTNTGKRAGDEVVQLYIHETQPKVKRPARQLRGFQRIPLAPGEQRTVTFPLPASQLAYYDEAAKSFVVNPGTFEIMVGSSSADIRATTTLTAK